MFIPMARPLLLLPLLALVLPACSGGGEGESRVEVAQGVDLPAPVHLQSEALHNLIRIEEGMYSGALPADEAAFAELAAMGIKTVIGVDGADPDVELAAKHGLRYVHVPIGYDGVPEPAANTLVRLVQEAEGPFYFHCHHGRHRGPAAAAVALRAATGCSDASARAVLEAAGTSVDYPGLWADVAAWTMPAPGTELPELQEVARVDDFIAGMAAMDRDWDELKALRAAGWVTPEDHPDLVLPRVAALFARHSIESAGSMSGEQIADVVLMDQMQAAVELAELFQRQAEEAGLSPTEAHKRMLEETFRDLKASCKDCHRDYRNPERDDR